MVDNSELMKILMPRAQAAQSGGQGSTPAPQPPPGFSGGGGKASFYLPGGRAAGGSITGGGTGESSVQSIGNNEAVGQSVGNMIGKTAPGAPFKTGLSAPMWSPPAMTSSPMDDLAPKPASTVPPKWQRFETAQNMQNAVRNDWSPNPTLIRLLSGRMS